jgi:hypothetical protein
VTVISTRNFGTTFLSLLLKCLLSSRGVIRSVERPLIAVSIVPIGIALSLDSVTIDGLSLLDLIATNP